MKKKVLIFPLLIMVCLITSNTLVSCGKEKKEVEEEEKEPLYPEIQKSAEEVSYELGKEIFQGRGLCHTCHKIDEKLVGPPMRKIATIYKEKGASIPDFLTEKTGPIVDPSQYSVMKTNFPNTKKMSEEELKGLETYILSLAK